MFVSGRIQKVFSKKDRRGATRWSLLVNDIWYGCGTDKPDVSEEDVVKFDYEADGQWKNVQVDSIEIIEEAGVDEPPFDDAVESAPKKAAPPRGKAASAGGTDWVAKDKRITRLACHKDAIQVLDIAFREGAIKLPTKQADKYEALLEMVDELTGQFMEKLWDVD